MTVRPDRSGGPGRRVSGRGGPPCRLCRHDDDGRGRRERGALLARRALGPRDGARRVVDAARPVGMGLPPLPRGVVRPGPAGERRLGRGPRAEGGRCVRSAAGHRHDDGRPDAARARHRGAEAGVAAGDRGRHRRVVPAVQRAGCRVRPGRPRHPRRARRRPVDRERPEGVDLGRALRQAGHPRRQDGPARPEAPRAHVLRDRDGPARCRAPAPRADDGRRRVQRGVPHRRRRARSRT